jgi:hypothetical protein
MRGWVIYFLDHGRSFYGPQNPYLSSRQGSASLW